MCQSELRTGESILAYRNREIHHSFGGEDLENRVVLVLKVINIVDKSRLLLKDECPQQPHDNAIRFCVNRATSRQDSGRHMSRNQYECRQPCRDVAVP
jgi:hypothetical protein